MQWVRDVKKYGVYPSRVEIYLGMSKLRRVAGILKPVYPESGFHLYPCLQCNYVMNVSASLSCSSISLASVNDGTCALFIDLTLLPMGNKSTRHPLSPLPNIDLHPSYPVANCPFSACPCSISRQLLIGNQIVPL